jgi:hypothetical protein
MNLDVIVKTIVLFTPVSVEAREWFAENVVAERWQWRGEGLGVDHQPAQGPRGMERSDSSGWCEPRYQIR